MLVRRALVLVIPAVAACASAAPPPKAAPTPAAPPAVASAAPDATPPANSATIDVAALRARETTVELKPFRVDALGGKVSFEVLATAAPTVVEHSDKQPRMTEVHFDAGFADATVECTVIGDRVDPATTARNLINAPADARAAYTVHGSAVADALLWTVDGELVWGPTDSNTVGGMKTAIAPADDATLVCATGAIGYRKSFERVARAAAASLRGVTRGTRQFREIVQVTHGKDEIGGGEHFVVKRSDGRTSSVSIVSMMLYGGGRTHAIDGVVVEVSGPSGSIEEITATASTDGELSTKIGAARTSPNQFAVEGTFQGSPVKTTLASKLPVLGDLGRGPLLLAVASGAKKSATYAELDLSTATPSVRTVKVTKVDAHTVALDDEKEHRECTLDAAGLCTRWLTGVGDDAFRVDRVTSAGVP